MIAGLFVHPEFLLIAAALISVPVIIHLINRMRFKRIRWAAMEFLLKSQKRNRRRLIIEQIILLLLRCLMLVLAGLLLGRFVGYNPEAEADAGKAPPGTLSVVLLDDSLSMADKAPKEKGGPDCLAAAKE